MTGKTTTEFTNDKGNKYVFKLLFVPFVPFVEAEVCVTDKSPKKTDPHRDFRRKVRETQKRKMRAKRQGDQGVWFGLGMFGLVGWSVAIPALLAIALGVWVDASYQSPYSWTLMLLVIGVGLGCLNAWYWVSRERRNIEEEFHRNRKDGPQKDNDDES